MKDRDLLAGFVKTVLVHRHAFIPDVARTREIGRTANMPASFNEAFDAPVAGAVRSLWARGRTRPGRLESLVDRYAAPAGMRALESSGEKLWLALAQLRRVDLPAAWKTLDALCAERPEWSWPFLIRSELGRVDIVFDRALEDLDRAEKLDPNNAWVYAFRARVLFQKDPGPAALAAMDRAIKLAPDSGWLRAWRADSRRKLGDLAGAEADLAFALEKEPTYDRAWLWLGKVLRARGKNAEAEAALTKGLKVCPHFEKAMAERARARLALGKIDAALADLETASALNHRHNSLWNWTAELEPLNDEKRGTLMALARHAEMSPRSARAWAWLGEALTQAGKAAEGLAALDRAATLSPRRLRLATWRGEALFRLGRLPEAERELDRAVRADADDGRARAFRGRVRFLRAKFAGAVADLELACSDSMVEYSWLYHWRAEAKASAGDAAGARLDAETASNLEPRKAEFKRLNDDDILESPTARFGWPFLAEHDLWFHRAFHGHELRKHLADVENAKDAKSVALRGRLRRLLGDDAGAMRDLHDSLNLEPDNPLAKTWLAELALDDAHSYESLSEIVASPGAPPQAFLYHAASAVFHNDLTAALKSCAVYLRSRPKSALAFMIQGEALWRQGKRVASEKSFAAATKHEPVVAATWLLRARASSGAKRALYAEKALDADPTYALITLSWHGPKARPGAAWRKHLERLMTFAFEEPERAGWYYRQDDIHYAPYHFQEYADARALLAIRPDSAWAEALTARGALRCPPDPELAKQGVLHARRAAKLAPELGWTRAWIGLGLIKSRRPGEAEEFFTECLRLQPLYHRALAWRGALRRGLGKHAEAVADLDRAIAVDELYPFAPHERSLARRGLGDWVGAALDLDRAYKLDWRYAWVFTSGREPGAEESVRGLKELDVAIAKHPSCVSLRVWRGDLLLVRGEYGRALADLFEAAAQDPAHPNAQAFLGRALLESGRSPEAVEPLTRAVQLAPSQWNFRGWLAEAEFRTGRRERAFDLISEIIAGTPAHWWALHLRARFSLELGRPRKALADLARADSYEGRHADGHHLAAQALVALGELAEAEAEVDKALRVSPHLGRALLLRAEIRRRQGRAAEALADWKTVFEKFPYLLNAEERQRVAILLRS